MAVEVVGRQNDDIVEVKSLSFVPADVVGPRKDEFDDDFGKKEARSLFVTV